MKIQSKACGAYLTNCYILSNNGQDIIIDPGDGAALFVAKHVKNPVAILNTHGHSDHVWDNATLARKYNLPIYIHKDDAFMLKDPLHEGYPHSDASFVLDDGNVVHLAGLDLKFHNFKGHTPGTCMIEVIGERLFFSGDFLFYQGIGRSDFPYSSPRDMKESLLRVLTLGGDYRLLPGHDIESTLNKERSFIKQALKYI